jgi:hypothetical protein
MKFSGPFTLLTVFFLRQNWHRFFQVPLIRSALRRSGVTIWQVLQTALEVGFEGIALASYGSECEPV